MPSSLCPFVPSSGNRQLSATHSPPIPRWRRRTSVYYRYYEFPQPHHVHPHYGVRTATHKLIYFHTLDEWELYDLKADPDELKNLYHDPAHARLRHELTDELQRRRKDLRDS